MRGCRGPTLVTGALSCLVLVAAACSSSSSGSSLSKSSDAPTINAGSASDPTGGADDSAIRTYGYGPAPAAGVTYQPGVVMIPAGPAAIRAATTDALVWTLDRSAKGVADLKIGSVLVATGRATGRVVALRDEGDNRIVTLAPVELTDIIRDGEISVKQALPADAMRYLDVPDRPGAKSTPADVGEGPATTIVAPLGPSSFDTSLARPDSARDVPASMRGQAQSIHRNAADVCVCGPSGGKLPPASKGSVAIPAGNYKITPSYKPNELALDIERDGSLKLGIHFAFATADLSIDSGVSIKGGLIGGSRFVVSGIKGLDVSVSAGAAGGNLDNEKIRIEVPVQVSIPVPPSPATAGLPLVITIEFVYSVETAITGKNSTIAATGMYGLEGPIGISGGSIVAPTFTVKQSIIDSLQGITLGPSGVVFAVKMKVQAGLGIPEASAGPFGTVTTSLGVTNGSSLGASLARCKGATLDMLVGGGASVSISTPLLDALKKLLPPGTNIPTSVETSTNILHRSQVVPDVPLCSGA